MVVGKEREAARAKTSEGRNLEKGDLPGVLFLPAVVESELTRNFSPPL